MGAIQLIHCRGQCKAKKAVFLFAPADVRSKYPICRACKSAKRGSRFGRQRGSAWRSWAKFDLSGAA